MKLKNNHFALRTKHYAKAARQAHVELQVLRLRSISYIKKAT